MKKVMILLAAGALVLAFALAGCAKKPFMPSDNEVIYGTWINPSQQVQKNVSFAGGSRDYAGLDDANPSMESETQLEARWVDSDGNTWYKRFGTIIAGQYKGTKWQSLERISKSGERREWVSKIVTSFAPENYPKVIDPLDPMYYEYRRRTE
jgi:hypothetical protein